MDKNKIVMIAVGAGIAGLLIGVVVSSFHQGGRGGYGHDMKYRDDDNGSMMDKRSGYDEDKKREGMIGVDHDEMDHNEMGHDMGMMVGSEREFVTSMIPHHEEAIASAKDLLARGATTPEIKTLAETITKAQEAEVVQMKEWYKNWYGVDYVADGKYKPMMHRVSNLSGADLDKVFLTDMIMHHKMAIMMAQSVDVHIEHDEIKNLSNNIKATQTAEIETMQNLLKTLN
jgi:uncharacterized protein (DUF305 family)